MFLFSVENNAVTTNPLSMESQLTRAISYEDYNELRRLRTNGIDLNTPITLGYESGPALAIAASRGNIRMIQELHRLGANMETYNEEGRTPLCFAAAHGEIDAVRELIRLGADINGGVGTTPLYEATYAGHSDIAHKLVQLGADISLLSYTFAQHGNQHMLDFILGL